MKLLQVVGAAFTACLPSVGVAELAPQTSAGDAGLVLLQASASIVSRSQRSSQVPYLSHSSGSVIFMQRTLAEGSVAWTDVNATYTTVPEEMLGATLFASTRKGLPPGNLTLTSLVNGYAYIWSNKASRTRNPDLAEDGWGDVGVMRTGKKKFSVWRKNVSAAEPVVIPILHLWVGGVAFKIGNSTARVLPTDISVGGMAPYYRHRMADYYRYLAAKIGHGIVAQMSFNRNIAAFGLSIVMLTTLAITLLFCWNDVMVLPTRKAKPELINSWRETAAFNN